MTPTWGDYVADIAAAIHEIEVFIGGMTRDTFVRDRKTVNAVIRSLEVMGEAAKRIPEDLRVVHPDIPWKRMAGMRDKLIHEYAGVDLDTVWIVLTEELPPLKPLIERLAKTLAS